MTPTIQCYDDQSMQMPPATVLCDDLYFQESHHQTSASDRMNSSADVQLNHQWNQYLRNRHLIYRSKRNPPYASGFKANIKRLLDDSSSEEIVSEEHLNIIRKRQSLLLITIQTMALFHHNQILENKLSALHKRIVRQLQKERQTNDVSTSE